MENSINDTPFWKICIDNPFKNCDKIYPIQQKKVRALIDEILSNAPDVESIIIFGSSVTQKCYVGSDIDIFVQTKSQNELIRKYFPFKYDLWTERTVDKRLKNEILKTGVVVYG